MSQSKVLYSALTSADGPTGEGIVTRSIFPEVYKKFGIKFPLLMHMEQFATKMTTSKAKDIEVYGQPKFQVKYTVLTYDAATRKISITGTDAAKYIRKHWFIKSNNPAKSVTDRLKERYITDVTTDSGNTIITLYSAWPWTLATGDEIQLMSQSHPEISEAANGISKMPSRNTNNIYFARTTLDFSWFSGATTEVNWIESNKSEHVLQMMMQKQNQYMFGDKSEPTVGGYDVFVPEGIVNAMFNGTIPGLLVDNEIGLTAGSVVRYDFNTTITINDLSKISAKLRYGSGVKHFYHDSAFGEKLCPFIFENTSPTEFTTFMDLKIGIRKFQLANGQTFIFHHLPQLDLMGDKIWFVIDYGYVFNILFDFKAKNVKLGENIKGKDGTMTYVDAGMQGMYWMPIDRANNLSSKGSELVDVGGIGFYGAEAFACGTHNMSLV